MGYRRPANKGMRCRKWQRVSGRGGRRLLRCKAFGYPRRRFQMGFRPGHVPANKGRKCRKMKLVFSPWYNKKVYRCVSYGAKRTRRRPMLLLPPPSRPTRPVARAAIMPPRPPPSKRGGPPMPRGVLPEGYVPLSIAAWERTQAGRTPV